MPTYLYITTRIVRSVGVVLLLVVAVVVVVVTVVVFLEGAWRSDSEQEIRE
jgi:ATP/ADP translocase